MHEMKLILLGSGTCVPSKTRTAPCSYLEAGGQRLLIDMGATAMQQMVLAGINYLDIDVICITHTHPDHISGLLPFLHASQCSPEEKRGKDLLIIGPPGFGGYFSRHIAGVLDRPEFFSLSMIEIGSRIELGQLAIEAAATRHAEQSVAYRFSLGDHSVVFTGDSDYDEGLIEFSRNTDLLVADCSFPDERKVVGHMTPGECGKLAKDARVKRLLLSHIYPADSPDSERVDQCRRFFAGGVLLAEDLMEIIVPGSD